MVSPKSPMDQKRMILVQVLLLPLELGMIISMSVSISYLRAMVTHASWVFKLTGNRSSAYDRGQLNT